MLSKVIASTSSAYTASSKTFRINADHLGYQPANSFRSFQISVSNLGGASDRWILKAMLPGGDTIQVTGSTQNTVDDLEILQDVKAQDFIIVISDNSGSTSTPQVTITASN